MNKENCKYRKPANLLNPEFGDQRFAKTDQYIEAFECTYESMIRDGTIKSDSDISGYAPLY